MTSASLKVGRRLDSCQENRLMSLWAAGAGQSSEAACA